MNIFPYQFSFDPTTPLSSTFHLFLPSHTPSRIFHDYDVPDIFAPLPLQPVPPPSPSTLDISSNDLT